ncbi:MAG TPA: glycosyltransferase, partial [Sphingobacteriaceae bacterium]|nr:glycosyltransferase [Sphingobacteriaceae bacterium]
MALTSIISVNYNQPLVTLEFLKSVKRNTIGEDVELILVDNGSHMDYGETFKSIYPELIYIRSK